MNEQEVGSNLVSLPAVVMFLVLFVLAANASLTVLSVFLCGCFLLSLTAWIWSKRALSGMQLALEGESARVFPGQMLAFGVRVKNGKLLPLFWLQVSFPVPEGKGFPPIERRLNWLLPMQSVSWRQEWRAERRGVLHIREAELFSGDGFGLSVKKKQVSPEKGLLFVVYPKVRPVNLSRLPRRSAELQTGSKGFQEDVTLLKNSRSYMPGDPAGKINWRMLAGSGQLEANLYETILPGQTTVILDLEAFSEYEITQDSAGRHVRILAFYEEELEEMISLAASLIAAMAQRKERTALLLPRTAGGKGCYLCGEDPEQAVPELLTALAEITYAGGPAVFSDRQERAFSSPGECLVLSRNGETFRKSALPGKLPEHRLHAVLWEKGGTPLPCHTLERRELFV